VSVSFRRLVICESVRDNLKGLVLEATTHCDHLRQKHRSPPILVSKCRKHTVCDEESSLR
jgi:hypothetical protein